MTDMLDGISAVFQRRSPPMTDLDKAGMANEQIAEKLREIAARPEMDTFVLALIKSMLCDLAAARAARAGV